MTSSRSRSSFPFAVGFVVCAALAAVLGLWCVQKALFPSAGSPLSQGEEMTYVLHERSGGPLAVARSFAFHSILMPEFEEVERARRPDWPLRSHRR